MPNCKPFMVGTGFRPTLVYTPPVFANQYLSRRQNTISRALLISKNMPYSQGLEPGKGYGVCRDGCETTTATAIAARKPEFPVTSGQARGALHFPTTL